MNKKNYQIIKYLALFFLIFVMGGCREKKNLASLSPMEIVDLYHTASAKGDHVLLRQVTYFPPNATEEEIKKKIGYDNDPNIGKDAEALISMMGVRIVSRYEKILDENTAEVGIGVQAGVGPIGKFTPTDQMILKKDKGIWKVDYSRNQMTRDQLIAAIKKNPTDAWPYYYLGMNLQAGNPYKAYKFYKKYCQLEPNGFFVSDRLQEQFERFEKVDTQEQRILVANEKIPEDGYGRLSNYLYLCQLFTEKSDYTKAKMYLEQAEIFIKKRGVKAQLWIDRYEDAKEILQSRMEGKTDDPLDKLLE